MANSAVVGILRVLLTANTAEFDSAMKRGAESAKVFSRDMNKLGAQATQLGSALTKTLTLPILGVGVGATKLAMDFESSFAGVRKTVNATQAEFKQMETAFRNLAKTIPINVNEINRLGEAAGALGIPKQEIVGFAKVMAELGVTTNVTADQAAESIAKIQNIFGAAGQETERFASTLVDLGNKGASTEGQILEMATRLASASNALGITQSQVLGISTAIANVGIEAEAGGSAMSRVMTEIAVAVSHGGEAVEGFAKIAGKSNEEFSKLFKADAADAIRLFIEGLGHVKESGGDLILTLEELGFKEIRQSNLLRALAGNYKDFGASLETASTAWKDNTALSVEAQKRFETVQSKLTLLWNRIKDVGITLGNALLPLLTDTIGVMDRLIPLVDTLAKTFTGLPKPLQATVVGLAGIAALAGPALLVFGQLAFGAGALAKVFTTGGLLSGLTKFFGLAGSGTSVMTGLSRALQVFTGPVGWIIGATAGLLTATKTWDELLRILKALATILANVVTAAFRDFFIPIGRGVATVGVAFLGWLDRVAGGVMPVSDRIRVLGRAFEWTMGKVAGLLEALALLGSTSITLPKLPGAPNVIGKGPSILDPDAALDEMNKAAGQLTAAHGAATEAAKEHAKAVDELVKKLGGADAIAAAKLWMDALPRIGGFAKLTADDQAELNKIVNEAIDAYRRLGTTAPQAMRDLALATSAATIKNQEFRALALGLPSLLSQTFEEFPTIMSRAFGGLGTGPASIISHLKESISLVDELRDKFKDAFGAIPGILRDAFTGGGGFMGALKAIGVQMADALTAPLMARLAGMASKFAGLLTGGVGVGGAVAAGAGTAAAGGAATAAGAGGTVAAGAGVAGFTAATAGWTLGISAVVVGLYVGIKKLKEQRAHMEVNRLRDAFFGMQGGLEGLNPRILELTGNLDAVQTLFTAKNPQQWAAAVQNINDILAVGRQRFTDLQEAVKTVSGKLLGLTTMTPAIKTALDTVFDQTTTAGYLSAVQALNGELDLQAAKYKDIEDALKKYGLGINQAGKEFQQAKLNESAVTLKTDWQNLVNAGVDINAQMRAMGPSIRDFIKDAKAAGLEVPNSMKQVIQTAIDAGEVFDENGDKITDMSQLGLTFGTTMETVVREVKTAMSGLELVLRGLATFLGITLPDAAADGAAGVQAALDGIVPPSFLTGGMPTGPTITAPSGETEFDDYGGAPKFHSGSGGVRDFGSGTLAVLRGREEVLTEEQSMARRAGGGIQIVNNFNGAVLAETDYIERVVTPQMLTGVERAYLQRFGRIVRMAGR